MSPTSRARHVVRVCRGLREQGGAQGLKLGRCSREMSWQTKRIVPEAQEEVRAERAKRVMSQRLSQHAGKNWKIVLCCRMNVDSVGAVKCEF